jgi:hypothetical protein
MLTHPMREPPRMTSVFFLWGFMCSGLSFCFVSIPVYQWIPVLLFTVLLGAGTLISLHWCVGISGIIVEEQERKRYDLLAALPHGTAGAGWAMSTGYLHRRAGFRWIPRLMAVMTGILLTTLAGAFFITAFVEQNMASLPPQIQFVNAEVLNLIVVAATGIVLTYLDYRYSLLTAVLIGISAPVDVMTPAEAKVRAVLAFMTVQSGLYAVSALLMLAWLPPLLALTGITGLQAVSLDALIGMSVYLALREGIVRRLWSRWMYALNSEHHEFETLLLAHN